MAFDLHVHSNASDGAWPVDKLVRAAAAAGLDGLAIADHDTVSAVPAAIAAGAEHGVRLLSAVELTCAADGVEMHLLGYDVDPQHTGLRRHAESVGTRREIRMRGMIERLERLGAPVNMDDVLREAGTDAVLGRPHLARALVSAGHVSSVGAAFERFLSDAGPAWVGMDPVSAHDAISLVHDAGGVAVWAHPRTDRLDASLAGLIEAGLDGLEVYRLRSTPSEVSIARTRARDNGLLMTGGSDWHGPWNGRLGDFLVTRAEIEPFLERIGWI